MIQKPRQFLSPETWTFIILTIVAAGVFFRYVDLAPHVTNDFFFSTDDPNLQADLEISRLFDRNNAQAIISVTGEISGRAYQEKIRRMSEIIAGYDAVSTVKSLSHGPKNFEDAFKSPLWSRILIAENRQSSNLFVILDNADSPGIIKKLENLILAMDAPDFRVRISGFPYIVEQIRRHLMIDLNIFSALAFGMFSLIVIIIFHSWRGSFARKSLLSSRLRRCRV